MRWKHEAKICLPSCPQVEMMHPRRCFYFIAQLDDMGVHPLCLIDIHIALLLVLLHLLRLDNIGL